MQRREKAVESSRAEAGGDMVAAVQRRGEERRGVPELPEGGISVTCDWSDVGVWTIDGAKPSPR